jgi:FKBP-type peptidyl-prolyl cis-trans isomerase 2
MTVKKGSKIKVDYTGTLDDGTVFDSSTHGDHSHPLEFKVGASQVIKGFDDAVIDMKKGDEKNIHIKAADAYGEKVPGLIKKIPKNILPQGMDPKKGMMIGLGTPDGRQFPATIIDVTDTELEVDLNHPLAGKDLNFKIKIVDIE